MLDPASAPETTPLAPEELAFARRIFDAFGPQRFTPRNYYRRIFGGRAYTSEQDAAEIYQTIAGHARVVMPDPGIRGDDGWCLNPAVLPAVRKVANYSTRSFCSTIRPGGSQVGRDERVS